MVARNLLYLVVALAFLAFARGYHIPSVLACESREGIRANRREVVAFALMFGGGHCLRWNCSTTRNPSWRLLSPPLLPRWRLARCSTTSSCSAG